MPKGETPNFTHGLADKQIYVVAPPISFIGKPASITGICGIVGEIFSGYRIWIEIVVHVNTVYVIACYYISYYHANMPSALGKSGIKKKLVTVG